MKKHRVVLVGDYIKTISDKFPTTWRGKVRRRDINTEMLLIEWSKCGDYPTDVCTWVSDSDIKIARRYK